MPERRSVEIASDELVGRARHCSGRSVEVRLQERRKSGDRSLLRVVSMRSVGDHGEGYGFELRPEHAEELVARITEALASARSKGWL